MHLFFYLTSFLTPNCRLRPLHVWSVSQQLLPGPHLMVILNISVGWLVGWLVGLVKISAKGGKLHFHAPFPCPFKASNYTSFQWGRGQWLWHILYVSAEPSLLPIRSEIMIVSECWRILSTWDNVVWVLIRGCPPALCPLDAPQPAPLVSPTPPPPALTAPPLSHSCSTTVHNLSWWSLIVQDLFIDVW